MGDDELVRARQSWLPALRELLERTLLPALMADRVTVRLDDDRVADRDRAIEPSGGSAVLELAISEPHGLGATVRVHRSAPPFAASDRVLARHLLDLAGAVLAARPDPEGAPEVAAAFVEEALSGLDDMVADSVQDRLCFVARLAMEHLGCAAWWVAMVEGRVALPQAYGARDPRIVLRLQQAARRLRPLRAPSLAALLEGGSLYATWEHPTLGPHLTQYGFTEVLAAGGYDTDALQWVLSLADDDGQYLHGARSALFAAVQAALGFPRNPLPGNAVRRSAGG